MSKQVAVVVLVSIEVPDDWDMWKVEYHLRKGYVALGEVSDIDDVTDYVTIENVIATTLP